MPSRAARLIATLALCHAALAQTDVISALNSAGLSTFANALGNTSLLSTLDSASTGTIFAPTNAALVNTSSAALANAMPYYVARGSFAASSIPSTGDAIVSSFFDGNGTLLPGNQSQVLVLGKNATGSVQIRQGLSNATVLSTTTAGNVIINTIDSVPSIPANLSATATAAGLTSLAITLQQVLPGAIAAFEQVPGITVFAPVNSAFLTLETLLSSIPSGTVGNVLANHVLNGSVIYTPSMTNGAEAVSSSGQILTFSTNSTGTYVSCNSSTVQILIPDVPISNGVVQVVSGFLIDPNTDADQAAAAYSSAQANAPSSAQTSFIAPSLPTAIASIS